MKTVMLPEDPTQIQALFEQVQDEDIILQLTDGRQFILSAIDDFEVEIAQTRRNEKLMAFLDERAKQTQTIPLDEVKRRLGI